MRSVPGVSISFILIAVFCMVVVSCEESTTLTSASSEHPAEIIGDVIIPEYLCSGNSIIWNSEGEGKVFWIIEITVRNNSYEKVISDDSNSWQIEAGNEIYPLGEALMGSLHYRDLNFPDEGKIAMGQSGDITVCFSVPDTLEICNATLCYMGQEPYSFGELTGGEMVEAYDWNSKTITQLSKCGNA